MRNLTGLPDPGDYTLGRGRLYFADIDATTGLPDANGFRFMGNCPEFNVSITAEKLEHKSSQTGLSVTDLEILKSLKVELKFSLDEQNDENMALWSAGEEGSITNPAIAGFSATVMTDAVKLGRWYEIRNSSGVRAYDIDTSKLTVRRDPSGTPVTLVLNDDYEVNTKMGLIFFLADPATASLVDGDEIDVALSADAGASPVYEVKALTTTEGLSGCLLFIQENAQGSVQREFRFHEVSISADGDLGLISEEIGVMQFSGSVTKNVLADADSPYYTVRSHAAA